MTSPAAVVGLVYDSEDLQLEDLQIFLEIVRGLNEPPQVRGTDTVVAGRAGRQEGSRVNDLLPIELVGLVSADPTLTALAEIRESYRANQRFLRNLFRTNRRRATLEATLEDGSVITIEARPLNAIWNERSTSATVSIELEGYDDWVQAGS
jgi:hypothetical protein